MLSNEEKCVQKELKNTRKSSLRGTKRKKAAGGHSFSKKKKGRRSTKKRAGKKLSHKRLSFPAAGCASLFFIQTREDIRNTHTHTHTHSRTRLAHALKARKESLLKTIVIRRKDVSREEE